MLTRILIGKPLVTYGQQKRRRVVDLGTAINVECGRCRYNGSFMLGTGGYYVLIENCLEALPEKRTEEVNQLIEKHPIRSYTFEFQLFQCQHCIFLFDQGILQVNFENDITYCNRVECPACQKDLHYKNTPKDKIHELICPICHGTDEMSLAGEMKWE